MCIITKDGTVPSLPGSMECEIPKKICKTRNGQIARFQRALRLLSTAAHSTFPHHDTLLTITLTLTLCCRPTYLFP